MAVSFAYIAKWTSAALGMSLMYRLKSLGPNKDPCGTPLRIGPGVERLFPTLTLNSREFWPIDLAKECDFYISSRSGSRKETPIACGYTEDPFKNRPRNYKPKIKDSYPQNLERQNKSCYIYAVIHLITQEIVNDQIDDWLQQGIIRESCSDYCSTIVLCKKVNGAKKTSSVGSNSQSPTPSPMENSPLVSMKKKKGINTAADSVRSGWPLWNRLWSRHPIESLNETKHAVFARRRS
ncbi:hypothetical protein TNCV_447341 [Trichonephila clavipes]|nr:hypothetical protein TNCV_447341 [Trichonephila clavipes]